MSDYFTQLAAKSLGLAQLVEPRLPSLYEPAFNDVERVNATAFASEEPRAAPPAALARPRETSEPVEAIDRSEAVSLTLQANSVSVPDSQPRSERRLGPEFPVPIQEAEREYSPNEAPDVLSRNAAQAGPHVWDGVAKTSAAALTPAPVMRARFTARPPEHEPGTTRVGQNENAKPLGEMADAAARRLEVEAKRIEPKPGVETETNATASETISAESRAPDLSPLSAQPDFPVKTQENPEPAIRVTIGRIEVRAITPPPIKRKPKPAAGVGRLSLEEYLKRGREDRQ